MERGLAIDVGKIGKVKRPNARIPSKAKAAKIENLQATPADLEEGHQAAMADFLDQQRALHDAWRQAETRYEAKRKALSADLKKVRT